MKTIETRLKEIMSIRMKLKKLGLSVDNAPKLQKVFSHMSDFVKEGATWSGTVFLAEINRYMDVKLCNHKDCDVTLRAP